MKIKLHSLSVLVICVLSLAVAGQKCNVDSGFRGGGFDIYYEQRDFATLFRKKSFLPKTVRAKLDKYLSSKLGDRFAKRLKFDEGRYLDLKRLKIEFPDLYESNLKIGAYYLLFYFPDPANGLKSYYSEMWLNEDGTVSREINLPDVASDPRKGNLISCREASSIAEKNGFPQQYQSIWFEYSSDPDVFVWTVSDNRGVEPDEESLIRGKGTYRKIEINANTGAVLRQYKETIVL